MLSRIYSELNFVFEIRGGVFFLVAAMMGQFVAGCALASIC
jgi:hypothetical protein